MKNKKGFTLIELLAVIVILAIIALIATPAIINVIENARKKAFENTAYGVLEGLRLNYAERIMTGTTSEPQEFTFPNSGLKLSGEQPAYGTAKIDGKGNISFALADRDKKWCAKKEADSEKVTIEDYSEENCKIDGTSGGGEVPEAVSFAEDSWETIAANVKAGNLSKYKVGDEKEVTLTGDYAGTYTVRLANISKTMYCNNPDFSQTACGFVVEFVDIITTEKMRNTNTNAGSWPSTNVYHLLKNTIYNDLPEELKKVIIDTVVVSGFSHVNNSHNYNSVDKLYLFSPIEIWSHNSLSDSAAYFTRSLDYYNGSEQSSSIKYMNSVATSWWLRTAESNTKETFRDVGNNGDSSGGSYATYAKGVAPAFRIG